MGLLRKLLRLPPKPSVPEFKIEDRNALELRLADKKDESAFLSRFMKMVPDGAVLDLASWIDVIGGASDRFRAQLTQFAAEGQRPAGLSVASRNEEVLRVRVDAASRPVIEAA